jgi:hypothetical protein
MSVIERTKEFWKNRGGNFGVATALLALPLAGSLAVAYDYAAFSKLKGDLVSSIDAALPMVMMDIVNGRTGGRNPDIMVRDAILANLDIKDADSLATHLNMRRSPEGHVNGIGVEATLVYRPLSGGLVDMLNGNDSVHSAWTIRIP